MATLTLRPNGVGNYQQWSVFGGITHWGSTSDQSDTTGVQTTLANRYETEALQGSSNYAGTINSVTAYMRAQYIIAAGTAVNLWRTHSTDYESSTHTLTASLADYSDRRTVNPYTGSAWTWDEVNDLEVGARSVTVGSGGYVAASEFWIEVEYTPPVKQPSDTGSGSESVSVKAKLSLEDSGTGQETLSLDVRYVKSVSDSGEGSEELSVVNIKSEADSGGLQSEKVRIFKTTPPRGETIEDALGSSTRTVEVVRVGTINLKPDYPGKQIVRLRDMALLYTGGPIKGLAEVKKNIELYKRGRNITSGEWSQKIPDDTQLAPALANLNASIEEIYERLQGKRLSGVDVEIWDQISGAFLGSENTDEHGTLVLPTDRQFVEVLQWKLSGGGYSDCFNGERAAGTPGLFYYFPCNGGKSKSVIESFPGVSGQQVSLPSGWEWYESGFFNRPALKSNGSQLALEGAWPTGRRGFQFLWYCKDATQNSTLFTYSGNALLLEVYNGYLKGTVKDGTPVVGTTELYSENWYLIQINTEMYYGVGELSLSSYSLEMNVFLGAELELTVPKAFSDSAQNMPAVTLVGHSGDGFDEIRHLEREIYASELGEYAGFLKSGRRTGKSQGTLGTPGW